VNLSARPATVASVCPHDCTSTCALEVERIDARTIGRVRGSHRNDIHARRDLREGRALCRASASPGPAACIPLRRSGPRAAAQFTRIGWDEALDTVAERFVQAAGAPLAARRSGRTSTPARWAWCSATASTACATRMKYSRWFSHDLRDAVATPAGSPALGAKRGADMREVGEHADLVVIWGGNPADTQINVMTHASGGTQARRAARSCVDPYRTGTAAQADLPPALRPGTDGALACAVMHVPFARRHGRPRLPARATPMRQTELEAHLATRTPAVGGGHHRRCPMPTSWRLRDCRTAKAQLHPLPTTASRARATARSTMHGGGLPGGHRRLAPSRRRGAVRPYRHVPPGSAD
jgi:anaerobic selenocysteine-containing dehydrogenase